MIHNRSITMQYIEDDPNPTGARNHGKPWGKADFDLLERLWKDDYGFDIICSRLGRSRKSVICKLEHLGHMVFDSSRNTWYPNRSIKMEPNTIPEASLSYGGTITSARIPNPMYSYAFTDTNTAATTNVKIQEHKMAANFETKSFINGCDAASLTDNQIFQRIAKLEAEIKSLEDIKTPSTKKTKAIEDLQADIKAMAEYVDNR